MNINIAGLIVKTLAAAGVKRIYGVVGDSLNGLTEALRKQIAIEWVLVRHEEVAAFAAGAEAQLTGSLTVCAGSCGPDNMHLINGLYDCHHSRVPVLAIAAQRNRQRLSPGNATGNPVQELQPFLRGISNPMQMPRILALAIQSAIGLRSVSVITIPGDIALPEAPTDEPRLATLESPSTLIRPSTADFSKLAASLNEGKKVTILNYSTSQSLQWGRAQLSAEGGDHAPRSLTAQSNFNGAALN
jgi:pyruvate dehydrogenase (quinone)